jgi:hypothetical protein
VSFNQLLVDQAQVSLNFAAFPMSSPGGERLGAGPLCGSGATSFTACPGSGRSTCYTEPTRSTSPNGSARFICFRSSADLPRIGIAALRAEAFIVTPHGSSGSDFITDRSDCAKHGGAGWPEH